MPDALSHPKLSVSYGPADLFSDDMVEMRVLLAGLFLTLPCAAEWTQVQREWALGTSALLNQLNGDRFDLLAGAESPAEVALRDLDFLARVWGINSREQLIQTIESLLADRADRMRIGWNHPRAVNLARWGYAVGYLREDEAWAIIMPAAQRLQQTFTSWQEMGEVYLEARQKLFSNRPQDRREAEHAYRVVVLNAAGPWRKYPWNLDLGSGRPIQASMEKTAWVTIAPHPEGLICVRLGVPDHTDGADHTDQLYVAAIEKAVGCHPRVTGSRHDLHDWVLDTECLVKDSSRGIQVVTHLRVEAIAEQLRREGFTQLFAYIQHEPYGSSDLVPPAYDSFVSEGLQWYVDVRSLQRAIPDVTLTYGIPPSGDSASKTAKAEEFLRLAKMDQTLRQTLAQMTSQVNSGALQAVMGVKLAPEQEKVVAELQDKVIRIVADALAWEKLKPAYVKLFAEAYSEVELDDILAFYKSPTGQSMVAKNPLLMTKASEIVQQRMAAAQPELEKLVRDLMVQTPQPTQPQETKK
jgi:hypothetical protein